MNKLNIRSPLTRQQAMWCLLAAVASITSGRAQVVGLPSNPQVVLQSSGASTTFNTVTDSQGQTLTVNSSARRVVIDWDYFDIAATNTVEFTFTDAGRAIAVNRVAPCPSGGSCSGGVAAYINGTLRSNGNVWILASGGVYFSSTARVDVAGLLATPADLDNINDFVNGAVDAPVGFTMPSFPGAVIVDPGAVIVGRGGATMLVGGSDGGSVGGRLEVRGRVGAPTSVTSTGLDEDAPGGQVLYGAAGKFRLVMKERAPDSLSSGDLELFDFIIDEGYRVDSFGDPLAAIVVASGSETRAEQVIIKAQRGEPDPNNPGSSAGIISSGSSSSSTTAQGIYIEAPINAYGEDRDGPFASALTIEGAGDTDVSISRGIDFSSNSISLPTADLLLPIVTLSSGGSIDIKGRDIEVLKIESVATSNVISSPGSATDIPDHVTVELQGTTGATLKASRDLTLQEVLLNGANLIADGNINLNYSLIDPLAGDINAGGRFDFIELPPDDSANPNDFDLTLGNITTVGDVAIVARGDIQAGNVDAGGRVDIRSSEQNLTVGGVQSDLGVSLEGSQAVTTGDVSAQDAVLLTAGGVLTTGNVVSAAGRAVLQAQSLSIGNVTAQLDADLTSTDGTIEAGDVASRSDVVNVKGSGDITLGSVTASSNITIKEVNTAGGQTPSPVNIVTGSLDGAEIRVESRGSANLGDVTAAADLLVSADAGVRLRSATAASVSLSSFSGGVDVGLLESGGGLTGGSVLSRTGNVNIEARQAIRTGDVDSAALVRAVSSESAVSVGDVTADLSVELLGQTGVAAGVVAAQKFIRVQALEGGVDTGALTATEEKIDIDALGDISAGAVTAGLQVEVNTTGNISLGAAQGTRVDISSSGGAIAIEGASVSTEELVRLAAESGVSAGSIESATSVDVQTNTGTVKAGAVEAKSGTVLLSGDSVMAGEVKGTQAVDLLAETGTIDSSALSSSGAGVRAIGAQAVTVGAVNAATDALLESKNASVTSGAITAAGIAQVRAATNATLAAIRGTRVEVSASGGAIAIEGASVSTEELVRLAAESGVSAGSIESATSVDVQTNTGTVKAGAVEAKSGTVLLSGDSVMAGEVKGTQAVDLLAETGTIDSSALSSSGAGVRAIGAQAVTVGAVNAATDALLESKNASVTSGAITAAGIAQVRAATNATLAAIQGTSIDVSSTGGNVEVGDITAEDAAIKSTGGNVTLSAVDAVSLVVRAQAGTAGEGDVRLDGPIQLRRANASAISTDEPISLEIEADRDIEVNASISSDREIQFIAGRNFSNSGRIETDSTTDIGDIEIFAEDVSITAPIVVSEGSVIFHATGSGGIHVGDGLDASESTLALAQEEIDQIEGAALGLHAGAGEAKDAGIRVGDLALDGERINRTILATEADGSVRIDGRVQGTNNPDFEVGFQDLIPESIEISGALGTLESPMGQVRLRAVNDILIGSQEFIDLANESPDPTLVDPEMLSTGFGGVAPNQLFVVSGPAQFVAARAVLQQNTGGFDGAGIRIGEATGDIASTFGDDVAPERIAVFGVIVGTDGVVKEGVEVVDLVNLLPAGTETSERREFNSCVIGGGACSRGGTDVVQTVTSSTPTSTEAPPVASDPAPSSEPAPASEPASEPTPEPASEPAPESEPASEPASEPSSDEPVADDGAAGEEADQPPAEESSPEESGDDAAGAEETASDDESTEESAADEEAAGEEEAADEEANEEEAAEEEESEEEQSEEEAAAEDEVAAEEEAANDEEEEAAEEAVAEVAAAETEEAEEDLRPLEIDPGSRDLLKSQGGGEVRDPGVGTANEDLWPQGVPPQPGVSP